MTILPSGHLTASVAASMSGGAVNLDFDRSFLVQMVAFTILMFVLKPVLFDPMLKLFEEREKRTAGARLLARKMDEDAGEMLRKYETELEKVRKAAGEEREHLRAEGQKLEAQILAEARAETAKLVEEGRARIAREAAATRAELTAQTHDIARLVASRVMEREVS